VVFTGFFYAYRFVRHILCCMNRLTTLPFAASQQPSVRRAMFAGSSYPSSERELSTLLDNALNVLDTSLDTVPDSVSKTLQSPSSPTPSSQTVHDVQSQWNIPKPIKRGASAIIAPHIDFRVGLSCYAPAYYALQDSQAEVFIVIATSHYGWQDLFIPTFQHFSTPLGTVKTDVELLNSIYHRCPYPLTRDDTAHREEHSIEFEVVWLQHTFGHRPFTIVPILVTSFYPFIQQCVSPAQMPKFQQFINAVREAIAESGKRVAWVVSGDMAHVGRKFGDSENAAQMMQRVHREDVELLRAMEYADAEAYYQRIAEHNDSYKICGLPPVYSMLYAAQPTQGVVLDYQHWLEHSTRSAVTYSSVAYYGELH